jgi:two-component system response regulator BaeR
MSMPLILVVEDEPKLAEVLGDYLHLAGYSAETLSDGSLVADWVRLHAPAVILLDLMLPGLNGFEVCRALREFSQVPIIMVTARVEEIDRLLGLESGADDYVCKPFSPREVVARVKALLRRSRTTDALSPLQLDSSKFKAAWQQQALRLTRVEFRLLQALSDKSGRVLSRAHLIDIAYQDHRIVDQRTIDSHVKNLRRKLIDAGANPEILQSVYGLGYKFDALAIEEDAIQYG